MKPKLLIVFNEGNPIEAREVNFYDGFVVAQDEQGEYKFDPDMIVRIEAVIR